jgi:TRAP-type C4-dicarboxylate transport system substrate-binding protein
LNGEGRSPVVIGSGRWRSSLGKRKIKRFGKGGRMMKRKGLIIGGLLLVMSLTVPVVRGAEGPITINYVTFVARNHAISIMLSQDLQEIEKRSGGKLKFNYRGGPESLTLFSQAKAVKDGAVDMCIISPDFTGGLLKGTDMLTLSKTPVHKHRETGAYDYLDGLYQKAGLKYLIMLPMNPGTQFHFVSKKRVEKPLDFKGLSLAGTGIFDAIGPALGMTPVAMQMAEQYTGLERGLIDVGRGGINTIAAFKLYEVAKHYIEPGFGTAPANLFMNLEKWKSIPKDQQDLLVNSLYEMAPQTAAKHAKLDEELLKKAQEGGLKIVEFKGADREWFLKTVNDAIYAHQSKDAPDIARKIFELTNK